MKDYTHVYPVKEAGHLEGWWRRWFQKPKKVLKGLVEEAMFVMDLGCGPGFFTLELARMVGEKGKVYAVDLQQGMLDIVRDKIRGTALEKRIVLHKCEKDHVGVPERMDLVLAFYVVHEVPDQERLLEELSSTLRPKGNLYIVEPKFHVSKKDLARTIALAEKKGLQVVERRRIFMSRPVLLRKRA